ncbi:AP-3 complex subunit beta-1 [Physocladia obscura]|uniref:AP-3 complex subunit beta-1 n=1 Tax=Physocladia obscura TaxID=109957 RepID=A0AAD5T445_9FUNG|nr:AP-3 complex subunit beta-1 [Physocladia obscura]
MMDQLYEKAASFGNFLRANQSRHLLIPIYTAGKIATAASEAGSNLSRDLTMGNVYETCEERMGDLRYLLDFKGNVKGKKHVVKNVASTSFEVRKLVYIYLLRYAEEEPDLALLSINTFQRDLTDRNPMIRAMALRVLSGIRVQMISPLILLALKRASMDMSAYVRKAVANALPKLVSADPNQQEACMELIEQSMNDNSTLVLGSAVLSLNDLCPERFDLIHIHWRKLCTLLIDADEWAQIDILGAMLRYARVHFVDPNKLNEAGKELDFDHKLLLTSCVPLLQSRNAAVVLAAARFLVHAAPVDSLVSATKALLRLLHTSSSEHQFYVLQNLTTLARKHPHLLQDYVRQFFLFEEDAVFVKDLKLEILDVIVCAENATIIVGKLKDLVRSWDLELAVKVIRLIGKVNIVAESVIVTRRLFLQSTAAFAASSKTTSLIVTLARSLDAIAVPMARACDIPKIAHDAFRVAVKKFSAESQIVKLQVLTFGAKIIATTVTQSGDVANEKAQQTVAALWEHVLNLARYDVGWDVRDRARLLKSLVSTQNTRNGLFSGKLNAILMAPKFAPTVSNNEKKEAGLSKLTLGSLSHSFNVAVRGYMPLPEWADIVKGRELRDAAVELQVPPLPGWNGPAKSVSVRSNDLQLQPQHSSSNSAMGQMKIMPRISSMKPGTSPIVRKKYTGLETFLDDSLSEDEEENEDKGLFIALIAPDDNANIIPEESRNKSEVGLIIKNGTEVEEEEEEEEEEVEEAEVEGEDIFLLSKRMIINQSIALEVEYVYEEEEEGGEEEVEEVEEVEELEGEINRDD